MLTIDVGTIAYISSTGEETSLTLLSGAGRVIYTVRSVLTAWDAGAVAVTAWEAKGAEIAWSAGTAIV